MSINIDAKLLKIIWDAIQPLFALWFVGYGIQNMMRAWLMDNDLTFATIFFLGGMTMVLNGIFIALSLIGI